MRMNLSLCMCSCTHTECVGVNLSLCVCMFAHAHIVCGSEPAWAGLLSQASCCLLATYSIPESRETSLLREPCPGSGKKVLQRPDSTVPSGKAATPGLTQAASPSPQALLSPHTGPRASGLSLWKSSQTLFPESWR